MKEVPEEWLRLIGLAEQLEFGEINITIKKSLPFMVNTVIKDIALFDEKKFNKGKENIL